MSFEPLEWVISTLTAWHFAIWLGLAALPTVILPLVTSQQIKLAFFPAFLWMLACVYGIFSLMFGQLFGDNYGYLEVLPAGFLFGAGFMLLLFFGELVTQDSKKNSSVGFALFGVVFGGVFFGSCTWILPRVIGFGLIDFPKYSWGVQL